MTGLHPLGLALVRPMTQLWSWHGCKIFCVHWILELQFDLSTSPPLLTLQCGEWEFLGICLRENVSPCYLQRCVQDCSQDDLVQGLKVTVQSCNMFFRKLRECGMWVEEPHRSVVLTAGKTMCEPWSPHSYNALSFSVTLTSIAIRFCNFYPLILVSKVSKDSITHAKPFQEALETKEGYGYLAAKCFHQRLKLFRLRPKLHFTQHICILLSSGSIAFSAVSCLSWLC